VEEEEGEGGEEEEGGVAGEREREGGSGKAMVIYVEHTGG